MTRHYDALARAGGSGQLTADRAWQLKIDWAEIGCLKGAPYSCDAAGWAYEHGEESRTRDLDKAYVYYNQGCILDSALSCNNLALATRHGRGIETNEQWALRNFAKACSLGWDQACSEASSEPDAVAGRRALADFEGYSSSMSASACAALYEQISRALASPSQTVGDDAVRWAVSYEAAAQQGRPCPANPSSQVAQPSPQMLHFTPTVRRIEGLGFDESQVNQNSYHGLMACIGKLDGVRALAKRLVPTAPSRARQSLVNFVSGTDELEQLLGTLRVNMPLMAPHLDAQDGEAGYWRARKKYDDAAQSSPLEQIDLYLEDGEIGTGCTTMMRRYFSLQDIYINAQNSVLQQ